MRQAEEVTGSLVNFQKHDVNHPTVIAYRSHQNLSIELGVQNEARAIPIVAHLTLIAHLVSPSLGRSSRLWPNTEQLPTCCGRNPWL